MATAGLDGVEVWDARVDQPLFAETTRLSGFETRTEISPDGLRVAWTEGARVLSISACGFCASFRKANCWSRHAAGALPPASR